MSKLTPLLIISAIFVSCADAYSLTSFVVVPNLAPKQRIRRQSTEPIVLQYLDFNTNVVNRLAETVVSGRIQNSGTISVPIVLPAGSYVTEYTLEFDENQKFKALVKGREDAHNEYKNATNNGQSAGIVESNNVRDSNVLNIDINLKEGYESVIFKLTYEQLLQRKNGNYEIITNIFPDGKLTGNVSVTVNINESRDLYFVRAPPLRTGTGNDVLEGENDYVNINRPNSRSAIADFFANYTTQREIANLLNKINFGCQVVVQYDVERDCEGGDLFQKNNYFMHFFAPCNISQIPKEIVFVLDTSGSMSGQKIEQLKQAMETILNDLSEVDFFTIVDFNTGMTVYVNGTRINMANSDRFADEAKLEYIERAKGIVSSLVASGSTNIMGALETGLEVVEKFKNIQLEGSPEFPQPMVIFLTDGQPATGETNTDRIIENVDVLNSAIPKTPMFCISFGADADQDFLQKLCSRNNGFHRHIYTDTSASEQLVGFYNEIASLTLTNLTFSYPNAKEVTKQSFPLFFSGYELIISGKTEHGQFLGNMPNVTVAAQNKSLTYTPTIIGNPPRDLDRYWAHLSLRQILEARNIAANKTKFDQAALNIALQFEIVTEVTSLVVQDTEGFAIFDAVNVSRAGDSVGYSVDEEDLVLEEFIEDDFVDPGNGAFTISASVFVFTLFASIHYFF